MQAKKILDSRPIGKTYHSIGHLPGSRLGSGDHSIPEVQAALVIKESRRGDRIIVTEKLDGACCSVANVDGQIRALTRAGWIASSAKYEHLQLFDVYVRHNLEQFGFLAPGERVVGEWLALAHGTRYDPKHFLFQPFVVFDMFRDNARVPFDEFARRVDEAELERAMVLYDGPDAFPVEAALRLLGGPWDDDGTYGYHAALDPVEGAVWRVETGGKPNFLCKYVRGDKVDGKYLPEVTGTTPIWQWRP